MTEKDPLPDKFSTYAQVGYADFADVDYVITDDGIEMEKRKNLQEMGLQIIIAE